MKRISIIFLMILAAVSANAQRKVVLNLQRTIEIAGDSSLQAFRNQNLKMSGYCQVFRSTSHRSVTTGT